MRKLSVRTPHCECGSIMDRDHNAAANLCGYPEERENRVGNAPTPVEMGVQKLAPMPIGKTRISSNNFGPWL